MRPDQWIHVANTALVATETIVLEGTVAHLQTTGKVSRFNVEGNDRSIPCTTTVRNSGIHAGARIAVTGVPVLAGTTPRLRVDVDTITVLEPAEAVSPAASERFPTPNHHVAWPATIRTIGLVCPMRGGDGRKDFTTIVRQKLPNVRWRVKPAPMSRTSDSPKIAAAIRAASGGADLVAIIRGGGPPGEMAVFNDSSVTDAIDQSPVPVITGIGHTADRTRSDAHAHTSSATPTAAAYKLTELG